MRSLSNGSGTSSAANLAEGRNPVPKTERSVVFVLDDEKSVRDALSGLLRSAGLQVRTFESASEMLRATTHDPPSCLILDLQLPGICGLDLQQMLAQSGGPPIVFISGHGDIPSSVKAMKAGAVEFLTKPFSDEELLRAIDAAIALDREAKRTRKELANLQGLYARLTARERDVLPLIVAGLTNKQSATKLGIAEITVQVHRAQIMRKTGAQSIPELVRMAGKLRQI